MKIEKYRASMMFLRFKYFFLSSIEFILEHVVQKTGEYLAIEGDAIRTVMRDDYPFIFHPFNRFHALPLVRVIAVSVLLCQL
jgi:hypothetical protein